MPLVFLRGVTTMRRLRTPLTLLPALTLLLAGLGLAPRGAAAAMWCFDAPVVQVNTTTAAINVGLEASPSDISSKVWSVNITVMVPKGATTQVIASTNQYFTEVVHFQPVSDPRTVGNVTVQFDMAHAKSPKNAAVQIVSNGVTTTTYGKTHQGLHAHFTVK